MKLYCLSSAILLALAVHADAGIVFSDRFNYPDGPITAPSGSPWISHAGTAQQLDVVNGAAWLTQEESEDVSAELAGGPYNQGTLYFSAVINVSKLPSGDGGFFLHLKDGANTQKARVYLSTNNAPPGTFHIGIANGSTTAVYLTNRCQLTQSYRIAVRYNAATPTQSTLWINPKKEEDVANSVTAVDSNRAASLSAIALRQSLSTGDGMGTLIVENLLVGTAFNDVAGSNTPPTLSPLPDQDIGAGEPVGPLAFTVGDNESPAESLTVRATSSNPELIAATSFSFSGTGANRSLRFQPQPGQQGVAIVQLEVSDGHQQSSTTFQVVVGKPKISGPQRAEGYADLPLSDQTFTVEDRETPPELLNVSVTASDPALFPAKSIQWKGSGGLRTLQLLPAAGRSGLSTLTVVVSDGNLSATNLLEVTVSPKRGLLLSEDFNRPDGTLISSGSPWSIHAPADGIASHVQVVSERLVLKSSNTEDFHASLAAGPFKPESGTLLYAGFDLRLKQLPTASGTFLAHFRDEQSGFRGRVTVATHEALAGSFRIGIASGTEAPVFDPRSFSLQETVHLVLKYNVANGLAQLWINATEEQEPHLVATDGATPITISNWSFRQADGMGEVEIDNLRVAGTYAGASPTVSPPRLQLRQSGAQLLVSWPTIVDAVLQRQSSLGSETWSDVQAIPVEAGGESSVTLSADQPQLFFRLNAR